MALLSAVVLCCDQPYKRAAELLIFKNGRGAYATDQQRNQQLQKLSEDSASDHNQRASRSYQVETNRSSMEEQHQNKKLSKSLRYEEEDNHQDFERDSPKKKS